MRRPVLCRSPQRCDAVFHVPGSNSALACAARAAALPTPAPPSPPSPVAPSGEPGGRGTGAAPALWDAPRPSGSILPLAVKVQLMLDREDAASGWDPTSGLAHPTGGYTSRGVREGEGKGEMTVSYLNETGGLHRADGPALLTLIESQPGPTTALFALRGDWLLTRSGSGVALQRFAQLVALGHSSTDAVSWMVLETRLGARAQARQDIDAILDQGPGLDVALATTCLDAGIRDPETVGAVARGELPMSWASA